MMTILARLLRLTDRLIRVRPPGGKAVTLREYAATVANFPASGYDIVVPAGHIAPHCDNLVLHRPGTCDYCDRYPAIQANRERLHVRFTGEAEPADWTPCPAEQVRDADVIDRWPGNRAQ